MPEDCASSNKGRFPRPSVGCHKARGQGGLSHTKHHVIISGTGRAGTTFLIHLLTELGFDTGFKDPVSAIDPVALAGMELDIRSPEAPYVIKSPWLCDYLEEVLSGGDVAIDAALIPVRDLYAAAQSRRDVNLRTDPGHLNQEVRGGLWLTSEPEDQEVILSLQLYKLLHVLVRHDIVATMLYFPLFALDPSYLYGKLKIILGEIPYDRFQDAFHRISRPALVHSFEKELSSMKDPVQAFRQRKEQKAMEISALATALDGQKTELAALRAIIAEKEAYLQRIRDSRSWRIVSYARSIVDRYPPLRAGIHAALRWLLFLRRATKRLRRIP